MVTIFDERMIISKLDDEHLHREALKSSRALQRSRVGGDSG